MSFSSSNQRHFATRFQKDRCAGQVRTRGHRGGGGHAACHVRPSLAAKPFVLATPILLGARPALLPIGETCMAGKGHLASVMYLNPMVCLPLPHHPLRRSGGWVSRAGGDGEGMRPRATSRSTRSTSSSTSGAIDVFIGAAPAFLRVGPAQLPVGHASAAIIGQLGRHRPSSPSSPRDVYCDPGPGATDLDVFPLHSKA